MTEKEVEIEIRKILNSKFIIEFKASIDNSDDEYEEWNDLWLEHVASYLRNDRSIKSEFEMYDGETNDIVFIKSGLNIYEEVAKEIVLFTNGSERTLAATLYDFIKEVIIHHEPQFENINYKDAFELATSYFNDMATKINPDWLEIVDIFDFFKSIKLQSFFDNGFMLINNPTYKSLEGTESDLIRFSEMQYIVSIGLFLVFENWKKNNLC
jgi:hypothetical protein